MAVTDCSASSGSHRTDSAVIDDSHRGAMLDDARPHGWRPPVTRMTTYLLLLRGINVAGKNKVPMSSLRELLRGAWSPRRVDVHRERQRDPALPSSGGRDHERDRSGVAETVPARQRDGGGGSPHARRASGGRRDEAQRFRRRAGDVPQRRDLPDRARRRRGDDGLRPDPDVDRVWPGDRVIYSQRLSAQRTKCRLNKAISTPLYQSMTIRSWSTTLALLDRMDAVSAAADDTEENHE